MIGNPVYLGHSVMCKTESIFKVGKYKKLPEEEWIRIDNTHEPLVTQELFDGANAKILSQKRDTTNNFVSVFSGLVKCGACGRDCGKRNYIYISSKVAEGKHLDIGLDRFGVQCYYIN